MKNEAIFSDSKKIILDTCPLFSRFPLLLLTLKFIVDYKIILDLKIFVIIYLSVYIISFNIYYICIKFCCCSFAQACLTLATPWTAARQASLFVTISQSLLRLMSIEWVIQCQWGQWLNDTESLAVLSLIDILQEIFKQHVCYQYFFIITNVPL